MNVDAVSRRFGAAVLVLGPLGLVGSSLFQIASDDDSVPASLAKIAAHPSGERAVIICDLLATLMLPAMLYLMRLAMPRAPRLALAGGAVSFAIVYRFSRTSPQRLRNASFKLAVPTLLLGFW